MPLRVTVHYRFHPLAGMELEVVSAPRRVELPITVRGLDGIAIKIPRWMTEPAAGAVQISELAALPIEALLAVAALLPDDLVLNPKNPVRYTASHGSNDEKKARGADAVRVGGGGRGRQAVRGRARSGDDQ